MRPRRLREALRLIVITDAEIAAPRSVIDVVRACVAGGARAVQLRDKHRPARELMEIGSVLRAITREGGALLFVNDRLDIALALEADGAHLGPDDIPVADARRWVPSDFLIGRSADRIDEARSAVTDGADYIGCGTVYPTATKPDAGEVIGVAELDRVAAALDVPVVGIGGITLDRAVAVAATHAAGVAVVSDLMAAEDPRDRTRRFLEVLRR